MESIRPERWEKKDEDESRFHPVLSRDSTREGERPEWEKNDLERNQSIRPDIHAGSVVNISFSRKMCTNSIAEQVKLDEERYTMVLRLV